MANNQLEAQRLLGELTARVDGKNIDVSFVTCVSDLKQYKNLMIATLLKNNTKKQYDIVPVFNFYNEYSAAQALNIGIEQSKSDLVVLCHQDAGFFESWIDILFERIEEIEKITKKWGVLGTGGILQNGEKFGIAFNSRRQPIWRFGQEEKHICPVQTIDEVCMIVKKSNGLRFDEKFDGFHFYGADFALDASVKGFTNYGIWNPTIHDWDGRSLVTGKQDYMRQLDILCNKWKDKFDVIRTDTAVIEKGVPRTLFLDWSFTEAIQKHSSKMPKKG